ncbi:MFS transporter [Corynebacterium sp. AOP40-9SA-29]|uniref:MFS transporter n=1 Tax=Corynebacterium sp. AOP40-9SA-29 TaxID=3457677 RepID=UPI004033EDBD
MSRPRVLLALILLAQFVIPLSISGTAVALPSIAADLGSSPGLLQWVVNGFNVSFAICTVIWGACSDRIGHSRSFRIGILLAVVGSALSAFAPSLELLDAGRIVAGVGAAAVLTGAAPLLTQLFEGQARARAFALFGTVNGLGLAAGPALSGMVLAAGGWRGIFAVHALVLVIALVGFAGLTGSSRLPASTPGQMSLKGLLDFSALTTPGFAAMTLVPVAGAAGFVTFLTYLPGALGAVHGAHPGTAGALMLVMTVPVLLAPMLVHRILRSARITPVHVVVGSFACLVLGGVGVSVLLRPDLPVLLGVAPMVLLGLGFGLPLGFVDAEALAAVPPERVGAASGVLNLFRIGSEAVFVAAFAAILAAVVTSSLPGAAGELTASGAPGHPWIYHDGLVAAALVMVGLVLVLGLAFILLIRAAHSVGNHASQSRE